jgi:hypothetical protein
MRIFYEWVMLIGAATFAIIGAAPNATLHAGELSADAPAATGAEDGGKYGLLPPLDQMTRPQQMCAKTVPLTAIDTDSGIEKLTGFPAGAGNAATHYILLEQFFKEDQLDPQKPLVLNTRGKGVQEIFKAVGIRDCRFTPEFYPALTAADTRQPDLIVYLAYTQALLTLAQEYRSKQDFNSADTVYRCGLIFGWHLTQAPESLLVATLGMRVKRLIIAEYARFLHGQMSPRAKDADEYKNKLEVAQGGFQRKLAYFLGNTLAFNSIYSAIRIATEDESPAWRREAILRLGVYRFGAPGSSGEILFTDPARQKDAEKALTFVAEKDGNQTNRELAVWVINKLTPESFMHLGQQKVGEKAGEGK